MNHKIEKTYPYVMGWSQLIFLIVIGGALGAFMTHEALKNDSGLVIAKVLELGPDGATIFFWCIAGIMYLLVVLGVAGIVEKIIGTSRLAITAEGVIIPSPPWKKGEAFFTYDSIRELSLRDVKNARFLTVKTTGKNYLIASNRLSKPEEFDEVTRTLAERAGV